MLLVIKVDRRSQLTFIVTATLNATVRKKSIPSAMPFSLGIPLYQAGRRPGRLVSQEECRLVIAHVGNVHLTPRIVASRRTGSVETAPAIRQGNHVHDA